MQVTEQKNRRKSMKWENISFLLVLYYLMVSVQCQNNDLSTIQTTPQSVAPAPATESSFLESQVIGPFRVWHVGGMAVGGAAAILIAICCMVDIRVPRTKEQIEANYERRQAAHRYIDKLGRMDFGNVQQTMLASNAGESKKDTKPGPKAGSQTPRMMRPQMPMGYHPGMMMGGPQTMMMGGQQGMYGNAQGMMGNPQNMMMGGQPGMLGQGQMGMMMGSQPGMMLGSPGTMGNPQNMMGVQQGMMGSQPSMLIGNQSGMMTGSQGMRTAGATSQQGSMRGTQDEAQTPRLKRSVSTKSLQDIDEKLEELAEEQDIEHEEEKPVPKPSPTPSKKSSSSRLSLSFMASVMHKKSKKEAKAEDDDTLEEDKTPSSPVKKAKKKKRKNDKKDD